MFESDAKSVEHLAPGYPARRPIDLIPQDGVMDEL